ncbi:MAG: FecR family protein [Akkermansiaceae bacterium]|nr:FecR family protein [Akkermansiaceae bacterium]
MTGDEEKLLHRYLDGAISSEEFALLEELLRTDPEARRSLRTLATIDSKWQQLAADEEFLTDSVEPDIPSIKRFWPMVAGIAALVVLGLFFFVDWNPRESKLLVARVIHVEGEGWVNGERELAIGDELFAGDELTMDTGLVELAYRDSGVHALATAPLSLDLESTMHVSLSKGEMKLVVPPQGIGFVVDTPERKITDLGTSFVVKANESGSRVLVLDGQIAINGESGKDEQRMFAGDLAKFSRDGKTQLRSDMHLNIAELTAISRSPESRSLRGRILGFEGSPVIPRQKRNQDVIARQILPLVNSGFTDRASLDAMKEGSPLRFSGIAGNFKTFPDRAGLAPYSREFGWLAWYQGTVSPPKKGRYRFWGYADNHLLVAINGKPVFEGSRRDSPFKELGIPRTNHPSYPCLNAMAGFACGPWFDLEGDSVQLDLVFGEIMNHQTSGLLLIEREGEVYEETKWGQPRWSLFLTEVLSKEEIAELENLRHQLETKLLGSFSVSEEAIWEVTNE